jgi:hypothetical protein
MGKARFREMRYADPLTAKQAATLIAWLCYAGRTDCAALVIGRNQDAGKDLVETAAVIASRFLEKRLESELRSDHEGTRFVSIRKQVLTEWRRGILRSVNGFHARVGSTRGRQDVEGFAFVEQGTRCSVQTLLGPLLRIRFIRS